MGKALLAGLADADVEELYPRGELPKLTDRTIVSMPGLREELARIRHDGYCLDDQELEVGLRCVAAPVFSPAGGVDASISISGPTQRVSRPRMRVLARLVRWHAWRASVARGVLAPSAGWPAAPVEEPPAPEWIEPAPIRRVRSTA